MITKDHPVQLRSREMSALNKTEGLSSFPRAPQDSAVAESHLGHFQKRRETPKEGKGE